MRSVNGKMANITLSVYLGELDAGFIREGRLSSVANYIPINQIRVLTKTAWLPNWALSVSRELPKTTRDRIRETLVNLNTSSPLLKTLKLNEFVKATDSDYDILRAAKNQL